MSSGQKRGREAHDNGWRGGSYRGGRDHQGNTRAGSTGKEPDGSRERESLRDRDAECSRDRPISQRPDARSNREGSEKPLPPPPPPPPLPDRKEGRTPPLAGGGSSMAHEAARLLRQRALQAQAEMKKSSKDANNEEAEDGELPDEGHVNAQPHRKRHVPIVWKGSGAMGAADVGGSSNPTPSSTPPTSQQRGTPAASGSGRKPPLPSYNSPADSRETSDSPAVGACMTAERAASPFRPAAWAPSPSPAAGPEPNGALSELEAIREKQKSMGFDPDAPVPLKSSPSVSSDDDGLAGDLKKKMAAASSLPSEPYSYSDSLEGRPAEKPKASRWMDNENAGEAASAGAEDPAGPKGKASRWTEEEVEEVEQPRIAPATPEDEVAAMQELNKKELAEVEGEEGSSASEKSPVGPGDLSPVRRDLDMLQECRSVFLYEKIRKISEGTYGVVYKARDLKTEEIVALKKVKMVKEAYKEGFPRTAIREMNILVQFHHPNIVNVSEVVVGKRSDEIYMVMEYMEHDLKDCMDRKMKHPFSISEVKQLMLQLLRGTGFLHKNWILHRDLKTSNILYNNKGQLKICDFGLARQFAKDPNDPTDYVAPIYTNNVVTLWYRAPELLLGSKVYSTPLDVWSCGCIMAEFLLKKPLFPGKGELDQLSKIFDVLGQPTEKRWPGFSELPVAKKLNLAGNKTNYLRSKFPKAAFAGGPTLSDAGFDLLNRMLEYDPSRRITCQEAEDHEWFRENPQPKDLSMMPTFPVPDDAAEKARKAAYAQAVVAAINKPSVKQSTVQEAS